MENFFYIDSPVGSIGITGNGQAITGVFFAENSLEGDSQDPLLQKAASELSSYFNGKLTEFTVPLDAEGTKFEKAVWSALRSIPWGETRTYGEIARMIGNPKACRAVGRAAGRNPVAIIIPCHRVIGQNGTLTGYAGGLERKKILLGIEGIFS